MPGVWEKGTYPVGGQGGSDGAARAGVSFGTCGESKRCGPDVRTQQSGPGFSLLAWLIGLLVFKGLWGISDIENCFNPGSKHLLRYGDWRHCYVGVEGPITEPEKVLGCTWIPREYMPM